MTVRVPPRDRLLAAARELFARSGYDAVSVRDLTARARANLGAVTYHFGSKEALYHAALESIAEPAHERVAEAARTTGSALERVEAVVRAALDHLAKHGEAPKCLLRELASGRPISPPMAQLMRRNIGVLSGIIADGQRDGTIRGGDPVLLALSVVSQPIYFKIAERGIEQALGIKPSEPAAWAHIVDHVVESVRCTIATTPKGPS